MCVGQPLLLELLQHVRRLVQHAHHTCAVRGLEVGAAAVGVDEGRAHKGVEADAPPGRAGVWGVEPSGSPQLQPSSLQLSWLQLQPSWLQLQPSWLTQ